MLVNKLGVDVLLLLCRLHFCKSFQSDTYVYYDLNNSALDFLSSFIEIIFKDVRVHAPITYIKLGIPIYFIDHSEFITVQCKKILSRANNEIKCFDFSSIKRPLRPHLRTIIAI